MPPDFHLPEDQQKKFQQLIEQTTQSLRAGNPEQAEAAAFDMLNMVNEHVEQHPPEPDPLWELIAEKEDAREWREALELRLRAAAEQGRQATDANFFRWWTEIARLQQWLGHPREALAAAQSAKAAAQRIEGMWILTVTAQTVEAEYYLELLQPDDALAQAEAALSLIESDVIYDRYRADLCILRAAAHLRKDDLSAAESELDAIAPLVQSVQENSMFGIGHLTAAKFLEVQAGLHSARGEYSSAVERWQEIVTCRRARYDDLGRPGAGRTLALALHQLAKAQSAAGFPADAASAQAESLALLNQLGLPSPQTS